ncbi:MAG: hypothetical protein J5870_04295 [Clostridia bacterium]|nr:hypothetical protein [Clostridia bacterium]
MKKYISIFIVFALLFSFSACGKVYFDEEKYNSKVSEEESKSERESSEDMSRVSEKQSEVDEELGKTEKDKKIVVKYNYGEHSEIMVTYFKNGKSDYRMTYKYYNTDEYYKKVLDAGDVGSDKLVDHDNKARLVVYKNKDAGGMDFETVYEMYARRNPEVCQVIE